MSELTPSRREVARRIGISEAALRKAECVDRIAREPNGLWNIEKTHRRLAETADPDYSPLATRSDAEITPYARLKIEQLALKIEAQRLAIEKNKRRLLDVSEVDSTIDRIAGAMRDTLLNWPARVSGLIAAELGVDPYLLQTILQKHINDLLNEAADRFDPPSIGDRQQDL
jgi:hypothetical protein